jgi:hypothetical protein
MLLFFSNMIFYPMSFLYGYYNLMSKRGMSGHSSHSFTLGFTFLCFVAIVAHIVVGLLYFSSVSAPQSVFEKRQTRLI